MFRFLLHLHPRTIPTGAIRFRYTWCMGGIAATLFLVEVVTGTLLMFHYHPTPTQAYSDIVTLREAVPLGGVVRTLHRFASHGLILTVFLHMLRVFMTGSYQSPRRLNWVVGVLLLVLTHATALTGYLLPWDQSAYWTTTVVTQLSRDLPLLGSDSPPESLLLRYYILHCVVLPITMTILILYHFWKVRRDGGISGPL